MLLCVCDLKDNAYASLGRITLDLLPRNLPLIYKFSFIKLAGKKTEAEKYTN